MPFVLISVPSLLVASLIFLLPEPPRGNGLEPGEVDDARQVDWRKALGIFRVRTNCLIFAQGLGGCIPWSIMTVFFVDYLAQSRGFSVPAATAVLLCFGGGCGVGGVGGGIIGQYIYNRRKRNVSLLMGCSTLAGLVVLSLVFHDVHASTKRICAYTLAAGFFASVTGSNVKAVLLNVNEPEARGAAFAVFALFDNLGKGLGPMLVAVMISYWGREVAFNCGILVGWLQCGICLLLQFFTVEADERRTNHAAWLLGRGARVAHLELSPRIESGQTPRLELPARGLERSPRRLQPRTRENSDEDLKPGSFLACSLAASP